MRRGFGLLSESSRTIRLPLDKQHQPTLLIYILGISQRHSDITFIPPQQQSAHFARGRHRLEHPRRRPDISQHASTLSRGRLVENVPRRYTGLYTTLFICLYCVASSRRTGLTLSSLRPERRVLPFCRRASYATLAVHIQHVSITASTPDGRHPLPHALGALATPQTRKSNPLRPAKSEQRDTPPSGGSAPSSSACRRCLQNKHEGLDRSVVRVADLACKPHVMTFRRLKTRIRLKSRDFADKRDFISTSGR
ncbi:hypothetical protein D9619_009149 [Psilocybe cf. subviscida]|uniref:Uncharacterized protein n=1 Tax=Psilocybe cf. subviscida TaxID=2480587 RepID=A0A8H5BU63_9AGAR|nr:hypothetical protein D9619_009149 [Psilocybe cf. subviscida]